MESFNHHRSLSITNIRRNLQLPVSCSNHRSQYRAIANQKPWNRSQAQWPALPFEVEEKRWRRHDKSRNECTLNFIDWHLKSRAPTEAKGALFLADKRAGDVVHIRLLPIPILSFSFILSLRSFVSSFHAVTFCIQKTDFSELRNGRRNLVGCEQQPLGRRFLFFFFSCIAYTTNVFLCVCGPFQSLVSFSLSMPITDTERIFLSRKTDGWLLANGTLSGGKACLLHIPIRFLRVLSDYHLSLVNQAKQRAHFSTASNQETRLVSPCK